MKAVRKLLNYYDGGGGNLSIFNKSAKIGYQIGQKSVNTLSPLAAAFNSKPNQNITQKFFESKSGLFGLPELGEPEGFYLLKEKALLEANSLVVECCSPNRKRKMVEVFDHLSNALCKVADLSEFIRMSHPDSKYAYAAEDASVSIGVLVENLNTNKNIYDALKNAIVNGDVVPTSAEDDHVSRLFLLDFEQSGIHLNESKRERVVELNEIILTLGQKFLASASEPRGIAKDKLPAAIRNQFSIEGDAVIVPGLFSDHPLEITREAAYKIFLYPEELQEHRLSRIIAARHEMSSMCQFPSYAHRAMMGSLAETPELVCNFLNLLTKELKPEADLDFAHMASFKKSHGTSNSPLAPWDISYYTSLVRNKNLPAELTDNVSAYFSLGTVMEGLNELFTQLYKISLKVEETKPGELWASDVYKVAVIYKETDILGHIYCDFFDHANKSSQDCHFTIRGGKYLEDGSYQNPIVVLHLNLPSPSWMTPSLLSLPMLENLFHEMGHAMHSMLARTRYQHVTGTRCSTDFAEVPSTLMEYFANDPRVLHRIAKHYKSGEKLPMDAINKLLSAKRIYSAAELQLQTFYSHLDQRYHSTNRWPSTTSTTDILEETHNNTYSLPYVPNTAWQLRFGHVIGYGAKYYSYLMARAVASWIWQKYFAENPFDSDAGHKFHQEVLQHGGGKPPKSMVSEYLGNKVSPENLVTALMNDIHTRPVTSKN